MSSSLDGASTLYASGDDNASIKAGLNPGIPVSLTSSLLGSKMTWIISLLAVVIVARLFSSKPKLPAGARPLPKMLGLPFGIGRFWGIPSPGTEAAIFFGDMHKTLGPIYEWTVFGTTHIWIGTEKIAKDLLFKRNKNLRGSHDITATAGGPNSFEGTPVISNDEESSRQKNFIHAVMASSSQKKFFGYPHEESKHTLRSLIEAPEDWSGHLVTHCARTTASSAWGDPEQSRRLLKIVPDLIRPVSPLRRIVSRVVNLLTYLLHLPDWFNPFKEAEERRKRAMQDAFYAAQQDAMDGVKEESSADSWTRLWIRNEKGLETSKLDQHEAAHAIGSSALVSVVSTASPLHTFFAAISQNVQWMRQLQEEVDRVCGDRLPAMDDMPKLPILRAVVKECLRWQRPTPLGVPYITTEDDVYDGFYIPKGAMIHVNYHSISREPTQIPRGDEFKPERWLDQSWPTFKEPLSEYPTLRDDTAFGFGPRGCPGVELVLIELYTLIGALVWAFDIKTTNGSGKAVTPAPCYETTQNGADAAPSQPFEIKPRSEEKKSYILSGCEEGWVAV